MLFLAARLVAMARVALVDVRSEVGAILRKIISPTEIIDCGGDFWVACCADIVDLSHDAQPNGSVVPHVHLSIPPEQPICVESPAGIMVSKILLEAKVLKYLLEVVVGVLGSCEIDRKSVV